MPLPLDTEGGAPHAERRGRVSAEARHYEGLGRAR